MSDIIDDIEKWSEERLRLWIVDSVDRYQIVGLSEQQAFSYVMATMMFILARGAALSDLPAAEAGDRLTTAIDTIRRAQSRKRDKA